MKLSTLPMLALIAIVGTSHAQPREAERQALAKKIDDATKTRDAALAALQASADEAAREAASAKAWGAVESLELLCHEYDALHRGTAPRCADRGAVRRVARQELHRLPAEDRYSAQCEWRASNASKKQLEEKLRAGKTPTRERGRKSEIAWERTCGQHPFANQRVFVEGVDRAANAPKLRALFLTSHPSRFVFLSRNVDADVRQLKRGEAVLIYDIAMDAQSQPFIVTTDLVRVQVETSALSAKPIANTPRFAVKASDLLVFQDGKYVGGPWDLVVGKNQPDRTPPFLAAADRASTPYATFVKKWERFWKCADAKWAKLDPDGVAHDYDLATYDATSGTLKRVERLETALERKVCSACNCAAVNRERAAAARIVLAPLQAKAFSELAPIKARLDRL